MNNYKMIDRKEKKSQKEYQADPVNKYTFIFGIQHDEEYPHFHID